jgi:hypothetical protein
MEGSQGKYPRPTDLPSDELFGMDVYDATGLLVGRVDAVVRTQGQRERAMVRGIGGAPRCFFVDLASATLEGNELQVPFGLGGTPTPPPRGGISLLRWAQNAGVRR